MASITKSPGTIVNDTTVGTVAWNNPTNAAASDDVYATVGINAGQEIQYSNYLKCTNFGFAIPTNAIIKGVQIDIERHASLNTSNNHVCIQAVRLVKGGTPQGSSKLSSQYWPLSDAYESLGGSADMWGLTLTPADINASNFGVVLEAVLYAPAGYDSITGYVDHIRITVYYTFPPNPGAMLLMQL